MDTALLLGPINATFLLHGSAHVGVYIFFVLSGYLMGKGFYSQRYSLARVGIQQFYTNRIKKIVPTYFFVLLVIAALTHTYEGLTLPAFLGEILRHITFTFNGVCGANKGIGHFWTVATEMQFYLLVPLLFAFAGKWSQRCTALTIGVLIIFGALNRAYWIQQASGTGGCMTTWDAMVYTPLWMNLDLFFTGFLLNGLSSLFKKIRLSPLAIIGFGYLVMSYIAFTTHLVISGTSDLSHLVNEAIRQFYSLGLPSVTALYALMLIASCENRNAMNDTAQNKNPLARAAMLMGLYTYAIYLWHPLFLPTLDGIMIAGMPALTFCLRFIFLIGITGAMAAVTYYGLESRIHPPRQR
ncbi:MAG: acyltransferase [Alphaproteobacteria bacterium]|nr:acyltransferase [Alphaproteobacteria bacterium]